MNFTPTQQHSLLSKMGYDGPVDPKMMEAFLASNPGAAAKMGKFSRAAQKKTGMAEGGDIADFLQQAKDALSSETAKRAAAARAAEANPDDPALQTALSEAEASYQKAQSDLNVARSQTSIQTPTAGETIYNALLDPGKLASGATTAKIGTATPEQLLTTGTGSVTDKTAAATTTVSGTTLPPEDAAKLVQYAAVNNGKLPSEYEGKGIDTSQFDLDGDGVITNNDALLFMKGEGTLSYGGTPIAQAAVPTVTAASTYDATKAAGGIKEELQGVERDYKSVSWWDAGFTPPPAGTMTTQAFETFHNPTTGEQVTVSTGGYTAPEGWVKGAPEGKFKTKGLEAALGEVSQKVTAETMNAADLAQLGLAPAQIDQIRQVLDTGDLELTQGQLVEAATLANQGIALPQAVAQVTGQPADVVAAKFASATPEAKAVTDYKEVTTGTVEGTVNTKELVDAQGVGLTAEQAATSKAEYQDKLDAAKGTVGAGELIDAQTAYNLPPTESATLNETVVQDAAKAGEFPTAEAAQSSFQSTVQAAQGNVGANELVNAKDITKVAEAVEATAATMEALNSAAIAQAQTGTLSQAALAIAEQGTVPASATISGQMGKLMEQFNNGTPAWAAGAMRAANAAMAARGLGASSMAGAAIVQAAMEAAMPIAQGDAQMFMQMELTNLNNRQQVAIANAAAQQNIELANLNNLQQASLQNSANAFALQGQNLSNQQAVVLANAQMKAALQGQVLDVYTQTAMANAARYAEMNNLNLNNEQQTLLQRSAQNLQVDLTNLDATQQTALANLQVQASLRGQELTNEQQMAMLASTQAFQAAEFTANAKQQAFLQDAAARLAMEGKVMDITQQTAMFNAARIASVNDINLSNEQQVLLQRSAESLQVDLANLSTESQTALANAQLRAALQGKVLDNQQQAAVLNASRYAEVNNLNLTNAQQALMQDANIKASMEGRVLDNRQQTAIFNVSNLIQERGIELTNEQQTRLFNMTNKVNVDLANLSNRQQTALANAQIEAALRGQELTNAQQTGTLNAARIGEIANLNFTADQQRALENARLAQTVDVANLDARSAKVLADAAAMTNVDLANLNNRQQAQVQNAQNFLQMDLANLSNEQQTEMFKSQSIINSLLSDQAAENAAAQFNAASENQVNQFFADLTANVNKFNVDQKNAIAQFNAGETNATDRFNAQLEAARDQFNASNALIIAQANAKWRQDISTLDTAAQNEANIELARSMTAITGAAMNEIFQKERDIMDFAFTSNETAADRAMNLLLADKQADLTKWQEAAQEDAAKGYLWTKLGYDLMFGGSSGGGSSFFDLFK